MDEKRSTILQTINNPLGFFALALLIVEGFLGIVLIFAKDPHPENLSFWGMCIGAGLFLLVVLIVAALTWWKPDALGLSGKDYSDLKKMEMDNKAIDSDLIPMDGSNAEIGQITEEYKTLK